MGIIVVIICIFVALFLLYQRFQPNLEYVGENKEHLLLYYTVWDKHGYTMRDYIKIY